MTPRDRFHGLTFVIALGMLSYGLYRIDPSAMFIGIGALLLLLLMLVRHPRNRQHGRNNEVA